MSYAECPPSHEALMQAVAICIEECGATLAQFDGINEDTLTEWRFMGALGFGGKLWWRNDWNTGPGFHVNCYPEDWNPRRRAMIEKANERLRQIPAPGDLLGGTATP